MIAIVCNGLSSNTYLRPANPSKKSRVKTKPNPLFLGAFFTKLYKEFLKFKKVFLGF